MSIWLYKDPNNHGKEFIDAVVNSESCLFCNEILRVLKKESSSKQVHEGEHREDNLHVRTCYTCGWWWATKAAYRTMTNVGKWGVMDQGEYLDNDVWGASAVLRRLDLTNIATPIDAVRDHLVRDYKRRKKMHPRLFEETVASVFRDLGYHAIATAYSGDGGIDVVLTGKNGENVGVQVKRYNDRIGVAQIRELMGALYDKGWLRGIFVTTSDFQAGAKPLVDRFAMRGTRIELINADRFYDELKLAQRNRYQSLADADAPYLSAEFTLLRSDQYRRDP